ncbi:MAG TPA: response regulator, partial [Gemmatimonadaceae bacterium]|nr:response regulator [Gemmatimonadaceae bacterium]
PHARVTARTAAHAPGTETILLVEDEVAVRRLAERILTSAGYTVLAAGDGAEALQLLAQHRTPVHLLLTDVVLPGISGRELAAKVESTHPEVRVLYTSGYTDDTILRHGVLDSVTHFLGKPYTVAELTQRVREVLDGPAPLRKP